VSSSSAVVCTAIDLMGRLRESGHLANPYPLYASLRQRPVRLPTGEIAFSSYADVGAVLKDPKFGKPPQPRVPVRAGRVLSRMFLLLDPPDHTRLRRVVLPAFLPPVIAKSQAAIAANVAKLLPAGPCTVDLVREFAFALPLAVIGDQLGVPPADREQIARWSRTMTESLDNPPPARARDLARVVKDVTARRSHPIAAVRAATRIVTYARRRLEQASREPETELLAALVRSQRDGTIDADEAQATWVMLVIAGHETTANLIGLSVLALLDHPEVLSQARSDPSLLGRVVDECLRYDSPVPFMPRVAHEVVTLNGVTVERGQTAVALIAAANRDPAVFPDPDRLDLDRPRSHPHFGFGYGIHFCVGSVLAKLETEAALGALLPRLEPHQDRSKITRLPHITVRGLASFPIRLTPR